MLICKNCGKKIKKLAGDDFRHESNRWEGDNGLICKPKNYKLKLTKAEPLNQNTNLEQMTSIKEPKPKAQKNSSGQLIVIGCNYHTKWQNEKSMRFVLKEISKDFAKARLITRVTKRDFWTDTNDLIFIRSPHNIKKAKLILAGKQMSAFS